MLNRPLLRAPRMCRVNPYPCDDGSEGSEPEVVEHDVTASRQAPLLSRSRLVTPSDHLTLRPLIDMCVRPDSGMSVCFNPVTFAIR